jgi:hypothetical protein
MLAEQVEKQRPLILARLADGPVAVLHWPELIANARRLGITTMIMQPRWPTADAVVQQDVTVVLQLCQAANLTCVLDLSDLALPPDESGWGLRHLPSVPSGVFRSEARTWLTQLATLVGSQHPKGPLVAFAAPHFPPELIATLQEWLRADRWHLPLMTALPATALAYGWPFEQPVSQTQPLRRYFRPDGSARLPTWDIKPLAMLVQIAATDIVQALPPTSPEGPGAWADSADIDIGVRHSIHATYLSVRSRRSEIYSGMLTYRDRMGELLHLHTNLGAQRSAIILLQEEAVVGAVFSGDASEGVWLARAMQSSIAFNGGAGGAIPCGRGLLLTAAQSGRFQLRRIEGWAGLEARRLTMQGLLIPCACQIDANHLTIPYVSEDQDGQTDLYIVMPTAEPLPEPIAGYLQTLLIMLATTLRQAAALARGSTSTALITAARHLETAAVGRMYLQRYEHARTEAEHVLETLRWALAGELAAQGHDLVREPLTDWRTQILNVIGSPGPT